MSLCRRCGGTGADPEPVPEQVCCGRFEYDPLGAGLDTPICCENFETVAVEIPCTGCGGSGLGRTAEDDRY